MKTYVIKVNDEMSDSKNNPAPTGWSFSCEFHRFFRRAGDMLDEFAQTGDKIASTSIAGFWARRSWLDPEKTPKVSACVKEILRSARKH